MHVCVSVSEVFRCTLAVASSKIEIIIIFFEIDASLCSISALQYILCGLKSLYIYF